MYNTVPADEPLVQTKAAPTSIKKLIFAVAATVIVLGAVFATFVAPKSTIVHRVLTEENLDVINGTYQSAVINGTYLFSVKGMGGNCCGGLGACYCICDPWPICL